MAHRKTPLRGSLRKQRWQSRSTGTFWHSCRGRTSETPPALYTLEDPILV